MKLIQQLELNPNVFNVHDIFWRALIGNVNFAKEEAEDDNFQTYFEAYLDLREDIDTRQKNMS